LLPSIEIVKNELSTKTMLVKSVSTRRAALSFVAILAVLATSAEHAMASSSENASSRRMLRQANANERKLGFWSWTNLLGEFQGIFSVMLQISVKKMPFFVVHNNKSM
jgi:hypothetical protein